MAVTPVSISKAVRAGDLEQYVMLTTLEKAMAWTSSNSIWPAGFGLACCAIEMMSLPSPRYDIARFGSEVFRSSPRQADLMIVSGRVSHKMVAPLRQVYDQMLLPKWVMAMGACSSSGGMFANYAILQGVDKVVPVDVHVPGCPPRPEAVVDGLLLIQKKIPPASRPPTTWRSRRRDRGAARSGGRTGRARVGTDACRRPRHAVADDRRRAPDRRLHLPARPAGEELPVCRLRR